MIKPWQPSNVLTPATVRGVMTAQGTGAGDYTTASTSFVDVDSTNMRVITVNARKGDILKVSALLSFASDALGHNLGVTFNIAGTDVGNSLGLAFNNGTAAVSCSLDYYYTMTSDTQVTIKLRFLISSGTATIYNRSAVVVPLMSVVNLGPAPAL